MYFFPQTDVYYYYYRAGALDLQNVIRSDIILRQNCTKRLRYFSRFIKTVRGLQSKPRERLAARRPIALHRSPIDPSWGGKADAKYDNTKPASGCRGGHLIKHFFTSTLVVHARVIPPVALTQHTIVAKELCASSHVSFPDAKQMDLGARVVHNYVGSNGRVRISY